MMHDNPQHPRACECPECKLDRAYSAVDELTDYYARIGI